jgi:hypothetical protein
VQHLGLTDEVSAIVTIPHIGKCDRLAARVAK